MERELENVWEQLVKLPEEQQEQISERLLSRIEKLHELRAEIDKGLRSLDAGEGVTLDFDTLIDDLERGHVSP